MGYGLLKGRAKISAWKRKCHSTDLLFTLAFRSVWRGVGGYRLRHDSRVVSQGFHPATVRVRSSAERLSEQSSSVTAISESTRKDLLRFSISPADKVSTVHLGFGRFASASTLIDEPTAKPYLLYVGARGAYKNFSGMLKAV